MAKYTVTRYLLIESIIEADSAEKALRIEEGLPLSGDLTSKEALDFSWQLSDAMGAWVSDEQGAVVLEEY